MSIAQASDKHIQDIILLYRQLSMSSPQLQQHSDDTDGENRYLTVTRIYSDKNGESRFGSFRIRMKGSGDIIVPSREEIYNYHVCAY